MPERQCVDAGGRGRATDRGLPGGEHHAAHTVRLPAPRPLTGNPGSTGPRCLSNGNPNSVDN